MRLPACKSIHLTVLEDPTMADDKNGASENPEPRGFGEHSRGLAGEYAHEQGWGLNEEERRAQSPGAVADGGTDYDYGAQDFGDEAVDTSSAKPSQKDVEAVLKD